MRMENPIYFWQKTGISGNVVDNSSFTRLRHPAHQALSDFDPDVFDVGRILTNGNLEMKFLLLLINQQQRPGAWLLQFADLAHY